MDMSVPSKDQLAHDLRQRLAEVERERDELNFVVEKVKEAAKHEVGHGIAIWETVAALQRELAAVRAEREKYADMYHKQIDHGVKLQQLIENLKYDSEPPHPELHHHKMIVKAKREVQRLRDALGKVNIFFNHTGDYCEECEDTGEACEKFIELRGEAVQAVEQALAASQGEE